MTNRSISSCTCLPILPETRRYFWTFSLLRIFEIRFHWKSKSKALSDSPSFERQNSALQFRWRFFNLIVLSGFFLTFQRPADSKPFWKKHIYLLDKNLQITKKIRNINLYFFRDFFLLLFNIFKCWKSDIKFIKASL